MNFKKEMTSLLRLHFDNVMYIKKTMKELLTAVNEMKKDIEFIDKKLKEIKGRASFYRIVKASKDIDRLLEKYKEDKL